MTINGTTQSKSNVFQIETISEREERRKIEDLGYKMIRELAAECYLELGKHYTLNIVLTAKT